ncbi:MAG: hypothetical protein HY359_08300 [Candidatus Rokubacteria bacterium]|jgi:hypothetical protein|nr:hypothetical protein [Candidatus Rokubacteria bacterium]
MTREARFRQAGWAYALYGVVYWLGGFALAVAGLGPRGMGPFEGGTVVLLFVVGAALIIVVPWLLLAERAWFDRWVLSRRDFARILTVFVAMRALEVGRIALRPTVELVSVGGFAIPTRLGAGVFFLITLGMVVLLARAGWSREA